MAGIIVIKLIVDNKMTPAVRERLSPDTGEGIESAMPEVPTFNTAQN